MPKVKTSLWSPLHSRCTLKKIGRICRKMSEMTKCAFSAILNITVISYSKTVESRLELHQNLFSDSKSTEESNFMLSSKSAQFGHGLGTFNSLYWYSTFGDRKYHAVRKEISCASEKQTVNRELASCWANVPFFSGEKVDAPNFSTGKFFHSREHGMELKHATRNPERPSETRGIRKKRLRVKALHRC